VRAWTAAAAIAVAMVSSRAFASPEDLFGYGARSAAMAGTGTATSSDFEAAYTNPALLSRIRVAKLTLGFMGATFDEEASGDGLPGRIEDRAAHGLDIGADLPIPLGGVLAHRVSGALAFYTPSDVVVRGRILYPETPQFPLLSDRAQCVAIRMGLGLDIGHGVRLGGGFAALAEIVGSVIVATDSTGKVGSRIDDQLVATYAPIAGASYERPLALFGEPGTLRIGGVFRGALAARFSVSIDATKLSSLNIPVFNIAGLAQYDPLQAGLEVGWESHPREGASKEGTWKLALGATWKHWSDYPGPLEPTVPCPEDEPDCGSLDVTRLGFSDTVVPRIAIERTFPVSRTASFHARGGYFFEPTPAPSHLPASQAFDVPAQTLVDVPTRFFDADRHVFTAGMGVTFSLGGGRTSPLDLDLDAFAQAHVLSPRTVTLDAGEPDGSASTANVSGSIFVTGVQLGVGF
jgi:hypothetical protein